MHIALSDKLFRDSNPFEEARRQDKLNGLEKFKYALTKTSFDDSESSYGEGYIVQNLHCQADKQIEFERKSTKEMVTTERMFIFPISNEELQLKIGKELDEEMKKAYSEMLAGCIKIPEQHIWYTVWLMQFNDGSEHIIGDLCFKGLNADGSVEIGYGIKPEYEGRGLATEAVTAMAKWAITQPDVSRIEAEAEPNNIASQKVLQKSGFVPNGILGEEGSRYVWKNC